MNDAISSMIRGADNLGRFQRDVYRRALTVQGEALAEAEAALDAALTLSTKVAAERDALRSTVLTSDAAYDDALQAALRQHTAALDAAAERDVAIAAREALEASLRQVAAERDALKSAPSFRARVIAAAERLVDDDGRGLRDLAIAVRDLRNIRG